LAGIADPLRQLPDLHALLDVVEQMLVEGKDEAGLAKLNNNLYAPAIDETPTGFDAADTLDAFGAFSAAADGFQ
jgi:hypothetical protein